MPPPLFHSALLRAAPILVKSSGLVRSFYYLFYPIPHTILIDISQYAILISCSEYLLPALVETLSGKNTLKKTPEAKQVVLLRVVFATHTLLVPSINKHV